MDGTGKLFAPLLPFLDKESTTIISYPTEGQQDYEALMDYVKPKLPKEDFILVAESFSGPIGAILAGSGISNLKAVVFVATFLSTPRRFLVKAVRQLPIKFLSKLPLATAIYRKYLFGARANEEVISQFQEVLSKLPEKTLKQRLLAIDSLKPTSGNIDVPAVYIQAEEDQLVEYKKFAEFKALFSSISIKTIRGPHFILQTNPEKCAEVINCGPHF